MLLFLSLLLLLTGCAYRIQPVPVTMDQMRDKHYVRAASYYFWQGEYKKKLTTLVTYDGVERVLKDKNGNLVTFGSKLEMMNFFASQGWRYVEPQRVEVAKNVRVDYLLFERKDWK